MVPEEGTDTDQLRAEIADACEALPPAARPRRVRFVEQLELRESKLSRQKAPS